MSTVTNATLALCAELMRDSYELAASAATAAITAAASSAAAVVEEGGDDDDEGCSPLTEDFSVGLHIGAIFIVLAASALGALIPVLGKHVPKMRLPDYAYAVGKSCATGVLLAVAMIHMVSEGASMFNASCAPASFVDLYEAWAFCLALIAAIVMHFIDSLILTITQSWARKKEEKAQLEKERCSKSGKEGDDGCPVCNEPCGHKDGDECEAQPNALCEVTDSAGTEAVVGCEHKDDACHEEHGHSHAIDLPDYMSPTQRIVAALSLEFGVTLHSVFVGLTLGIAADDELRVLLIALVFHQLFEGIAMGSRLADATFNFWLELMFVFVFAFSAPVGVAAGTGAVSASKSALTGSTYVMLCAIFDSVCGGILLYLGFVLLLVDFPIDRKRFASHGMPYRWLKEFGLFFALWVGAGVMALIGKWL